MHSRTAFTVLQLTDEFLGTGSCSTAHGGVCPTQIQEAYNAQWLKITHLAYNLKPRLRYYKKLEIRLTYVVHRKETNTHWHNF